MENMEQDLSNLLNELENKLKRLGTKFNVSIVMSDVSFEIKDEKQKSQNETFSKNSKIKENGNIETINFSGNYRCPRNSDGQRDCRRKPK